MHFEIMLFVPYPKPAPLSVRLLVLDGGQGLDGDIPFHMQIFLRLNLDQSFFQLEL